LLFHTGIEPCQRTQSSKIALPSDFRLLQPGDSGQGDALFGARAAATPGTDMKKVFIHNVTGLNQPERAGFAAKDVHIFDTYVGAALEAYQSGLISKEGLLRVAAGAQRELSQVLFTVRGQKAAREKEPGARP
jgi:hypothetical protein